MFNRKMADSSQGGRKQFSPESFGDFPVIEEERIATLREQMAKEAAKEEWETLEDAVEH